MKAHGDGGFRLTFDAPDSEAPAYIRLLLARGHILTMITEWDDTDAEPPRKRKAKRKDDDGGQEDTDRYFTD